VLQTIHRTNHNCIPGHTHLMGAGPVEIGALVPKGQANVDVVYELLDF
jgi:2-dehydropantoate 2-reductase